MVNEATPVMIAGRLYTSTSLSQVAAIDARTGQTLWAYDPESYTQGSPLISGSSTVESPIGLMGRRSAFSLGRGMRSSLPSMPKRDNRSRNSVCMAASI
jgi:outer membrane protein assembly factor BamB